MQGAKARIAWMIGDSHVPAIAIATGSAIFLLLLMLLEKGGLPHSYNSAIVSAAFAAGIVGAAFFSRTAHLREWRWCGYRVAPSPAGMALAACALAIPAAVLLLPGQFLADSDLAPALLAGPLLGLTAASILVAPFLRNSGAGSLGAFMGLRFPGTPVAPAITLVVIASCFLLLWTQMRVAVHLAALVLPVEPVILALLFVFLSGLTVVGGGIAAVTRVNMLLYLLLAVAWLAPLAMVSMLSANIPIPQFGLGTGAIAQITQIENELAGLGIQALGAGGQGASGASALLFCIFVALAIMALPALLNLFEAARNHGECGIAAGWSLFYAALVAGAAPAAAAFVKLGLYRNLLGLPASEALAAIPWLGDWGTKPSLLTSLASMVEICGATPANGPQIVIACGAGPNHAISPADIAVAQEFAALALPQLHGLPNILAVTACLCIAGLALAGANALLFAIAAAVADRVDIFTYSVRPREMQRIFAGRLAGTIALVGVSAAQFLPVNALMPGLWGMALSAGLLAPLLLTGLWWPRMSAAGALAGMAAGMIALVFYPLFHLLAGPTTLAALPDAAAAALLAFAFGVVVIFLFSILQPARVTAPPLIDQIINRPERESARMRMNVGEAP